MACLTYCLSTRFSCLSTGPASRVVEQTLSGVYAVQWFDLQHTRGCRWVPAKRLSDSTRCRAKKPGEYDLLGYLGQMANNYLGSASSIRNTAGTRAPLAPQGIHILLSCFLLVWVASVVLDGSVAKLLALEHGAHKWWSTVTDSFYSSSGALLARNLFLGYMFGRVVENTEGPQALWLTHILSSLGAGLLCWSLLPRRVPLAGAGMTGALCGLFLAATLFNRFKTWHWQRVAEMAVLAPFLLLQLLQGHAALSQWWVVSGVKLGSWVPVLGGCLGAAVAAAFVQLIETGMRSWRRRNQQQRRQEVGGQGEGRSQDDIEPLSVLLKQVASAVLKKVL